MTDLERNELNRIVRALINLEDATEYLDTDAFAERVRAIRLDLISIRDS